MSSTEKSSLRPSESGLAQTFILIGGFLGAGKTTCLMAFARWILEKGQKCGIITNDQGEGLIDTQNANLAAYSDTLPPTERASSMVQEVTGGCFCCRSDDLIVALRQLDKALKPDVFLAEPVGSCTDLVATVLLPLQQVYGAGFRRAPMSVVVDAKRSWANYFGRGRTKTGFSKDVRYIYAKQIEEAEILVVNKSDLLNQKQRHQLQACLTRDFPMARILFVSAITGDGLESWFEAVIHGDFNPRELLKLDYSRYGAGEASLGWYNGRFQLAVPKNNPIDGNKFVSDLATKIAVGLAHRGIQIAHFKISLQRQDGSQNERDLCIANIIDNNSSVQVSRLMRQNLWDGEMLINLRAQGSPEILEQVVSQHVEKQPVAMLEQAAFKPGPPRPTHRITSNTNN